MGRRGQGVNQKLLRFLLKVNQGDQRMEEFHWITKINSATEDEETIPSLGTGSADLLGPICKDSELPGKVHLKRGLEESEQRVLIQGKGLCHMNISVCFMRT